MSVRIYFGYETVTLPAAAMAVMERAGVADIRLLMALCTDKRLRELPENDYAAFGLAAGISEAQAAASLAFWRGAGILTTDREGIPAPAAEALPAAETSAAVAEPAPAVQTQPAAVQTEPAAGTDAGKEKTPKPGRHDQLPSYTTDQITAILESQSDMADFIDEAQNVWGKMFNTHEINILLGLVDYLGLEFEYVLILLAYCRRLLERRGSGRTLHYVETTAFSFYDEGVTDPIALSESIRKMEMMAETEGQLRSMFGMGTRTLSATEKRHFSSWLYDFGYDIDIIRRAYDITVDAIGAPKIKYINSILSSWHAENLTTLEAIEAYEAAKPRPKTAGKSKPDTARKLASSFETDDFFDAAMRRSFGDDYDSGSDNGSN